MSGDRQVELESILFQARALRDAMMFIYQSDAANVWRFSSYQTFIRNYHKIVVALAKHAPAVAELDFFDEEKIPGPYDTVAMTQKNYFDAVLAI